MTVSRAIFRPSTLPRLKRLAVLGVMAFLAFNPAIPVHAAAVGAATKADVYANGSLPANRYGASLRHNGVNNPISNYTGISPFNTAVVSLPGPPGLITNLMTITIPDPNDWDYTHIANLSIIINTSTGAVTASGTDIEGTILGTTMTLVTDGTAAAAPVDETFFVTSTADPSDRAINACANFSSGVVICLNVNLIDETPPTPPMNETVFDTAINNLANSNYADAFRMMTEQMSTMMMQQLPILGTFFDAKHQLESQRLFGLTAAIAHRDYQPSEQICALGTLARSTATSRYDVDRNALALNTILQKRELLNANVSSAWGPYADVMSRMEKFKSTYCNRNDNNADFLPGFCTVAVPGRINKDVDYRRTLESRMTLELNLNDGTAPTVDEQDILALAKNLYAHETFTSIPVKSIAPNNAFREFQNTRMISAVRSVARHSFASMAAMRMEGSGMSSVQLKQVMQNLGVPAGDIDALIGANPSYFAQMDILTQKMFQDPAFMINLHNGPANVARMGVVLQGIRLMADRDKLDAALRREMLVSMILEMKIREREEKVKNLRSRLLPNQQ